MTTTKSDERLTTEAFWDEMWEACHLPVVPVRSRSYDRCFMNVFEQHLRLTPTHRFFEVGAAPGKWMAYFHRQFGCRVAGCEYSPRGIEVLRQNLALLDVPGEVYEGDFLTMSFPNTFDVVLSLGFIEHFADPMEVVKRQVDLLSPGGLLVLEVPNMRGLNRWLQNDDLLRRHNLGTMSIRFFRTVAERFALDGRFLRYVGGFEPANIDLRGKSRWHWAIYVAAARFRRLPVVGGIDSRWWSGFLMGVFQKRSPTGPNDSPLYRP
jgi:SAM-dependent methyltransferase